MSAHSELIHKWSHTYSILSILPFPKKRLLFAGTQDSKILVFDLPAYNLISTIRLGDVSEENTNTRSSVLCLAKSENEEYLFSAGADSLVRVWNVSTTKSHEYVNLEEVATIYSVTDIGDIFSVKYLDKFDAIVFGCQNASLLYLENIFERINAANDCSTTDIDKLPHRRYDKFFDSNGPNGTGANKLRYEDSGATSDDNNDVQKNAILEIPSDNIIPYAHNGFIYSLIKLDPEFSVFFDNSKDNGAVEYIVSASGDGVNKVWKFSGVKDYVLMQPLDVELDNKDSVISQAVEFPFLYTGLSDGVINIWDLSTKQLVSTLRTKNEEDITSISVYHDHIFAIDESGINMIHENQAIHWNPNQGKILSSEIFEKTSTGHNLSINLLAGGNDGSLTLWDVSPLIENGLSMRAPLLTSNSSDISYYSTKSSSTSINNEEMLDTLKDLIQFRTVSQSKTAANQMALRRCATYLQQLFNKLGASNCQLLPASNGGSPIVTACFKANASNASKKTLLWYGHYDVISAGDPLNWQTDPFTLTCENGYMKGRGVTDNKGPLVSAIYSVTNLYRLGKLGNDVVFLVEGNEECGSPGFAQVCREYKKMINSKIDWILLSNSTWVDETNPCLNYGLRGVINAKVSITSDAPDRHSGVDGGVHREPTSDLINVISKLQDSNGKVLIPNFYSTVKELEKDEYDRFKNIIEIADINSTTTADDLVTNWAKPSLSITSMKISGPGNVTVIPKTASIGLSIRLVPGQIVEEIREELFKYIKSNFDMLKTQNHLKIELLNEAEPWLGDPHNHAYSVLREELALAWEKDPLFVREGGSIPCLRTLEHIFEAPAVQIPCGQSTDNAHLNNENLRIKNWTKMAEILTSVLNRL
ncbi:putative di- and tripeptidase DUG2 [Nakaseomyces bracarensis]|uniref:Di- and tripeptidase DUG2 n=1 Tax=Nakaseomyces bracarensis TaxID=273131 RepID=A0ABR4P0X6_9SACH